MGPSRIPRGPNCAVPRAPSSTLYYTVLFLEALLSSEGHYLGAEPFSAVLCSAMPRGLVGRSCISRRQNGWKKAGVCSVQREADVCAERGKTIRDLSRFLPSRRQDGGISCYNGPVIAETAGGT